METYNRSFGGSDKVPGIFAEFSLYKGAIVVSDPELVQELYGSKGKYLEKHPKPLRLFSRLLTEHSMVFRAGTEDWAHKRKLLTEAFLKSKLQGMLKTI